MVYLENTEQNLTTLGRGVHYYVLRKCCYFSCRFVKKWIKEEVLEKKIIEKLTMFPMSPDDHLLTNRKQSLIRSKQTPDPSVQFLVNKFALKPYVKQHFHGLLGKHWTEFNHTWRFHTIASVFLEKRLLKNKQCFQFLLMTICWRIGKNPSSDLSKHQIPQYNF
jgi:hypothetical protein